MNMMQEEIVDEIRRMCGKAFPIPSLGWHFKYHRQTYVYVTGKDKSMIRFNIPFVAGLSTPNREQMKEAVNDTNRNVKYIKATLPENDGTKVSLDYDHKITSSASAKDIVPHIIHTLDFAVEYLKERVQAR